MDIGSIPEWLMGTDFTHFFVKSFALVFCFLYLIYAIIITKEVQTLNKTLEVKNNGIITFITSLQILFAAILIIIVFTFI